MDALKGRDQTLETYIQAVRTDVQQHLHLSQQKKPRDNLQRGERAVLQQLRSRPDMVIKPADKGSAVVIMSTEDYIAEAERQLGNSTHYQQLLSNPTDMFASQVKRIVQDMFERDLIK